MFIIDDIKQSFRELRVWYNSLNAVFQFFVLLIVWYIGFPFAFSFSVMPLVLLIADPSGILLWVGIFLAFLWIRRSFRKKPAPRRAAPVQVIKNIFHSTLPARDLNRSAKMAYNIIEDSLRLASHTRHLEAYSEVSSSGLAAEEVLEEFLRLDKRYHVYTTPEDFRDQIRPAKAKAETDLRDSTKSTLKDNIDPRHAFTDQPFGYVEDRNHVTTPLKTLNHLTGRVRNRLLVPETLRAELTSVAGDRQFARDLCSSYGNDLTWVQLKRYLLSYGLSSVSLARKRHQAVLNFLEKLPVGKSGTEKLTTVLRYAANDDPYLSLVDFSVLYYHLQNSFGHPCPNLHLLDDLVSHFDDFPEFCAALSRYDLSPLLSSEVSGLECLKVAPKGTTPAKKPRRKKSKKSKIVEPTPSEITTEEDRSTPTEDDTPSPLRPSFADWSPPPSPATSESSSESIPTPDSTPTPESYHIPGVLQGKLSLHARSVINTSLFHAADLDLISSFPIPRNKTHLAAYLHHTAFLSNTCPHYGMKRTAFAPLLKKETGFAWTRSCQKSFEALLQAEADHFSAQTRVQEWPLRLTTDASESSFGAVLWQMNNRQKWVPLHLLCYRFTGQETGWSEEQKQTFAVSAGLEGFSYYLCHFEYVPVYTSCRSAVAAFTRNPLGNPLGNPTGGPVADLSGFNYTVEHIPLRKNGAAHYLTTIL